jgi:hypothetical protein
MTITSRSAEKDGTGCRGDEWRGSDQSLEYSSGDDDIEGTSVTVERSGLVMKRGGQWKSYSH